VGRSEARDLADKHPEKVKELAGLWLAEEKKNVPPLNATDEGATEFIDGLSVMVDLGERQPAFPFAFTTVERGYFEINDVAPAAERTETAQAAPWAVVDL